MSKDKRYGIDALRKGRACLPVELAKPKTPARRQMLPAKINHLGPFASKIGPICKPQKKDRKMYMEKIQPMLDSLYAANWCVETYAWITPTVFMRPKQAIMPENDPRTTSHARRPPSGNSASGWRTSGRVTEAAVCVIVRCGFGAASLVDVASWETVEAFSRSRLAELIDGDSGELEFRFWS